MAQLMDLLPKSYGYVVLAVAGGSLVNVYHIFAVAKARKQYGVKSPETYSQDSREFNCVMRAHMNYLENYPFYATTMLLGGLQCPRVIAGAGLLWLIARVAYAEGYAKDPAKRGKGFAVAGIAQIVMLGCTVGLGLRHSGMLAACRARFGR